MCKIHKPPVLLISISKRYCVSGRVYYVCMCVGMKEDEIFIYLEEGGEKMKNPNCKQKETNKIFK